MLPRPWSRPELSDTEPGHWDGMLFMDFSIKSTTLYTTQSYYWLYKLA